MSPLFRTSRSATLLLVEDNEGDVFLTREGLRRLNLQIELHHVPDGEACLAFLRKQGKYLNAPTPDLILLDLNMPIMSGREVMAELLADDELKWIPVVVLTTADDHQTIQDLYRKRCSSYVVKPLCFEQFQQAIKVIAEYWFSVATVPGEFDYMLGKRPRAPVD